jgi:hypothetical protein
VFLLGNIFAVGHILVSGIFDVSFQFGKYQLQVTQIKLVHHFLTCGPATTDLVVSVLFHGHQNNIKGNNP